MEKKQPTPTTLSIGGATCDIFVSVQHMPTANIEHKEQFLLPVGSKLMIDDATLTVGGGAANTSVGLARLGCNAAFCGVVADDQWGERIIETLKKNNVDTASTSVITNETSGFSVVLRSENGERTILHNAGVNTKLGDVTLDLEKVKGVDAVYMNRLSDEACVIHNDIIAAFEASPETHLSWNPGGCQIGYGIYHADMKALLKHTDVLFLNKEEVLEFTKLSDVKSAMKRVIECGAKIACITDGRSGADATDGTTLYHCPALPIEKIVDTTGAGDAFGCAMTWALLTGKTLPNAMIAGTLNATHVLGVIGAQDGLLTETEMQKKSEALSLSVTENAF